MAAVVLPVMGLQIIWRERPSWRGKPVALVADDTPESPLLTLSEEAWAAGLRPGLRQGAARNLVLDLCTAVVPPEKIEALSEELAKALQAFSPRVERARMQGVHTEGAFFVDPSGLERLYGGLDGWARSVERYFRGRGLKASVVVGFEPARAYALARRNRGVRILGSAEEECARTDPIGLRELGLPETVCDPLSMLGVTTLGAFIALPNGELHSRFGHLAAKLHRLFSGEAQVPMQPRKFETPWQVQLEVMPPDGDRERLLFVLKGAIDSLVQRVARAGERLDALTLTLRCEVHPYFRGMRDSRVHQKSKPHRKGIGSQTKHRLSDVERTVQERVEPAAATIDAPALLELIRLRLSRMSLPSDVEEILLEAETSPLRGEQLVTETERPKRDRRAAAEALARVRATFGDESVSVVCLRDAHLPEAGYSYERGDGLAKLSARTKAARATQPKEQDSLVAQRRLLPKPKALPLGPDGRPSWPEPIAHWSGPHRLSGGWWGRSGEGVPTIERDYFYAQTLHGERLYLYFDRRHGRWYLQGRVD